MWIVRLEIREDRKRVELVIHLNTIVRVAYLIGVYGQGFIPRNFSHTYTLFMFASYYVNKFVDHHTNALIP